MRNAQIVKIVVLTGALLASWECTANEAGIDQDDVSAVTVGDRECVIVDMEIPESVPVDQLVNVVIAMPLQLAGEVDPANGHLRFDVIASLDLAEGVWNGNKIGSYAKVEGNEYHIDVTKALVTESGISRISVIIGDLSSENGNTSVNYEVGKDERVGCIRAVYGRERKRDRARTDRLSQENGESSVAEFKVYPNPFNPIVRFEYSDSGKALDIRHVVVYDLKGRIVKRINAGKGTNVVEWNGRNERGASVPAGVYLCKMTCKGSGSAEKVYTQKIVLLK